MRCESVRERFSPWLDGELTPIELEAVREHLVSCPACRADLTVWEEISASLKEANHYYEAPPGFSASVIGQLQTPGRQRWFSSPAVRRWAASAAAVLILAAGSAGLSFRYWGGPGPQVLENLPAPEVIAKSPYTTGITTLGDAVPEKTDPASSDSGVTNPTPEVSIETSGPDIDTDTVGQPPVSGPMTVAENTVQPKVFLSKDRVITTTLLKLWVKDATEAYKQAVALGRRCSAGSQVLARQDGKYVVKFVVPLDKEQDFLAGLGGLGVTRDQVTDTQNVSANFVETLEEYRAVIAQLNASTDEKRRVELTKRAGYLENLLSTWDKETDKRIIVLWLES